MSRFHPETLDRLLVGHKPVRRSAGIHRLDHKSFSVARLPFFTTGDFGWSQAFGALGHNLGSSASSPG